jgi:hypothetical protein
VAGNQLWISDGSAITVFNTLSMQQLWSVPIPGGPQYLSFPPGFWAYVTIRAGDVDAINLKSHRVVSLLKGGVFGTMDFDELTGEVYVPDQRHKQIDVLTPPDPATLTAPHEPSYIYHLHAAPQSVAITGDGQLGVVALRGGYIALLDVPGKQVVKILAVGGAPHFIITGLYPPALTTTSRPASSSHTLITIVIYLLVIDVVLLGLRFAWKQYRKRIFAK